MSGVHAVTDIQANPLESANRNQQTKGKEMRKRLKRLRDVSFGLGIMILSMGCWDPVSTSGVDDSSTGDTATGNSTDSNTAVDSDSNTGSGDTGSSTSMDTTSDTLIDTATAVSTDAGTDSGTGATESTDSYLDTADTSVSTDSLTDTVTTSDSDTYVVVDTGSDTDTETASDTESDSIAVFLPASSISIVSGGGNVQSTNYRLRLTIGGAVPGKTGSNNYNAALGQGALGNN